MPGSLKNTALALARLSPSTVSSVVAPRGTPRGETELMVGGVVRLPVGQSEVVLAAKAAALKAAAAQVNASNFFIATSPCEERGPEAPRRPGGPPHNDKSQTTRQTFPPPRSSHPAQT